MARGGYANRNTDAGAWTAIKALQAAQQSGGSGGLAPAATRTNWPLYDQLSNGTDTGENTHLRHRLPRGAKEGLLLRYDNPTTFKIRVTPKVELASGRVLIARDRNGMPYLDIPAGESRFAQCRTGDQAAGAYVWSRTYTQAGVAVGGSSGDKWPKSHRRAIASAGEGTTASNGEADKSGAARLTNGNLSWCYGPSEILADQGAGLSTLLVVGDSISFGYGDGMDTPVNTGWVQRALAENYAYANLSRPGENAYEFPVQSGHTEQARRADYLFDGITHVVELYGSNDLAFGNLGYVQGNKILVWRALAARGLKVITNTVTPRAEFVGAQLTYWQQYNAWVRDGAPLLSTTFGAVTTGTSPANTVRMGQVGHPVSGGGVVTYLEVADATCTARDTATWKTNYSDDATHPNAVGAAAIVTDTNVGPKLLAFLAS